MSYPDKRHGSRGRTTARTRWGRLKPVVQRCRYCKAEHHGEGCARCKTGTSRLRVSQGGEAP